MWYISIIKGPLKPNLLPNEIFFEYLLDLCLILSFSKQKKLISPKNISEKKNAASITKVDLGFGSQSHKTTGANNLLS